jgi:hypothetical protein
VQGARWGLREAITGEFQPCCLASVPIGATEETSSKSSFFIPHGSSLDQKLLIIYVQLTWLMRMEEGWFIGLCDVPPANTIRFIATRANTVQQITSSCPGHRLNNLNKLTNSRSPIAQYIYHVRSWRRDVVVRWAGHGQVLTRSTRCPTCHIQLDHPVAHMDGVSNESTEEYQYSTMQLNVCE